MGGPTVNQRCNCFQYSEDGAICLCMHALYEPVCLHSHQSEHSMCYCFKYCICKIQKYHKWKTYRIRQSLCICAQYNTDWIKKLCFYIIQILYILNKRNMIALVCMINGQLSSHFIQHWLACISSKLKLTLIRRSWPSLLVVIYLKVM